MRVCNYAGTAVITRKGINMNGLARLIVCHQSCFLDIKSDANASI